MEHVREKYDFVFNKDKFSLDDYNDSINFGDLPASSPPPSGKILYFIFKHALTYCEKKMFWWLRKTFEIGGWKTRICNILRSQDQFIQTVKVRAIFGNRMSF